MSNKELKKAQIKCWQDLLQEKIQAWIDHIPGYIKEVIAYNGNNLYKEGKKKGKRKGEFIRFNYSVYNS